MYETHDKRALLLPNVTSADAGKVLAVDENGKLSLEEIGSGLPEVDSSDAGRVLTVSEDGEWEAASPSGGTGNFVVHISFDATAQEFVISETYEEIKAAIDAEKFVYGILSDPGSTDTVFLKVESYNSYEIQLSSDPTMTGGSGSTATGIQVLYFFVGTDGITGDTVVDVSQRTGTFATTA